MAESVPTDSLVNAIGFRHRPKSQTDLVTGRKGLQPSYFLGWLLNILLAFV